MVGSAGDTHSKFAVLYLGQQWHFSFTFSLYISLHLHLHLGHLVDAFVQSNLQ